MEGKYRNGRCGGEKKHEDDADDLHNLDEMKHSETTIEDISQQKKYGKKTLNSEGKAS